MSPPTDEPPISIAMPVFNALPYLDEAVASILAQTWSDFEFVIYDDASTDGSSDKLEDWARSDSRIKLTRGERNLGPAGSSNQVVHLSSAPVIARMDADDISTPDRLQREWDIMSSNPKAGIVGSLCDVIDADGRTLRGPEFWRLARSVFKPFPHGSMMFRRKVFDEIGGYREECEFWEDLDFVLRASRVCTVLVLPCSLYRYRQSPVSTRIASDQTRVENAIDRRYRALSQLRATNSYDDVLEGASSDETKRVDPRVFVSLGSLALWSQRRPRVLRRFLRRARFGFDFATAISAVWVSWASFSPGTLRSVMNMASSVRSLDPRRKVSVDEPVEWLRPDDRS